MLRWELPLSAPCWCKVQVYPAGLGVVRGVPVPEGKRGASQCDATGSIGRSPDSRSVGREGPCAVGEHILYYWCSSKSARMHASW